MAEWLLKLIIVCCVNSISLQNYFVFEFMVPLPRKKNTFSTPVHYYTLDYLSLGHSGKDPYPLQIKLKIRPFSYPWMVEISSVSGVWIFPGTTQHTSFPCSLSTTGTTACSCIKLSYWLIGKSRKKLLVFSDPSPESWVSSIVMFSSSESNKECKVESS